jgi:hypothetical protein
MYCDAIRKQNAYLSSIRIVPIQGISEDAMFYVGTNIEKTRGVKAILHHRSTFDQGRWSVVVSFSQFEAVKKEFRLNLTQWTTQACKDHSVLVDPSFPPPSLAFKHDTTDEEDSDGKGYQSYLSACSSIYTVQTDDGYEGHHDPPDSSRPVPQAWKVNIPSVIATTKPARPTTPTEPDDSERLRIENAQQRKQIETLTEQVITITQRLDEVLAELKSLKALNTQVKQGQPTRTSVPMNVDTSFNSLSDDGL